MSNKRVLARGESRCRSEHFLADSEKTATAPSCFATALTCRAAFPDVAAEAICVEEALARLGYGLATSFMFFQVLQPKSSNLRLT